MKFIGRPSFASLTKCTFVRTDDLIGKESPALTSNLVSEKAVATYKNRGTGNACAVPEELFVPGSVYYLKRNLDSRSHSHSGSETGREFFTLWKRNPGEHLRRIVLSSNLISDHKCDSHYYALRDVLKGLPGSSDESLFK